MSQNTGTLISASIRPNDSNDPIASAFANEVKGGLHSYATISERNSIITQRRQWGMLVYINSDDTMYKLKYNNVNTNILDNTNWIVFTGGGSGTGQNIKYYIGPTETVTVAEFEQYWVYGDLTLDGSFINNGEVVIANGALVNNSNNFQNNGTLSFVDIKLPVFNNGAEISFNSVVTTIGASFSAYLNDSSISVNKIRASNTPQNGQLLSYQNNEFEWIDTSEQTEARPEARALYMYEVSLAQLGRDTFEEVTLEDIETYGETLNLTNPQDVIIKVLEEVVEEEVVYDVMLKGKWSDLGIIDKATFLANTYIQGTVYSHFMIDGDLIQLKIGSQTGSTFNLSNNIAINEIVMLNFPPEVTTPFTILKIKSLGMTSFNPMGNWVDYSENIEMDYNLFTTYGYSVMEQWAKGLSGSSGYASFSNNQDSVIGTGLEAMLIASGYTVYG